VIEYAKSIGFIILNLDYSPVKGPEGNIEYLLHLKKTENIVSSEKNEELKRIEGVVEKSHNTLNL
jgi:23S rRNA (cytidine1920-2'-O)/16S rRNA (cytidine1409-2'-O)-methyltransferase